MKTKELIRQLQIYDPSGELEVSVGNSDILFAELLPAFWDGCQQILIRNNSQGYNVIGAKLVSNNMKISIRTHSIKDMLFNNPDLPIDYSDLNENNAKSYKETHDQYRQKIKEMDKEIKKENK